MKKLHIILIILSVNIRFSFAQKIDTIFVIYEPFELKYRLPTPLSELENRCYTDTIIDNKALSAIAQRYEKIITSKSIKTVREDPPIAVKMIVDISYKGKRIERFYYLGGRVLNTRGLSYEKDLGLLKLIMDAISSDERYIKELEERLKKYRD